MGRRSRKRGNAPSATEAQVVLPDAGVVVRLPGIVTQGGRPRARTGGIGA